MYKLALILDGGVATRLGGGGGGRLIGGGGGYLAGLVHFAFFWFIYSDHNDTVSIALGPGREHFNPKAENLSQKPTP